MSIPVLDSAVATVYPAFAAVVTAFAPIGGATTAIIVCTAALRLLLIPLTVLAVRGERARATLAPWIRDLQRRYASDRDRLQAEMLALYRSAGISPFAGVLPMLVQVPFFMVLYRLFTATPIAGDLSARLLSGPALTFVPVLLVVVGLALLAVRRMRRMAAATGTAPPPTVLSLLPFASLVTALVVPMAAVVFLVTTLTWTAVENAVLRPYPASHSR